MVEINLSQESIPTLCRLCLKNDDFILDIFNQIDRKSEKKPLPDRIFDLYQVKVEENDGLPKNICHRCLYLTESFTDFRDTVKLCERKLMEHIELMKSNEREDHADSKVKQELDDNRYEAMIDFHGFVPDENCEITVVDPNQECESSDDCFSMEDSENDYPNTNKTMNRLIPRSESMNESLTVKPESSAMSAAQNTSDISNEPKNTFLCQYCDMAFTAQINCDEHESRHDAANPFICNFCPFRAVNRQVLIHHIKESHDNERPFVCALCNKGFCRRSDLKKHTIVHTGVRPFSCPVCSKSFSRNTNLTKHLRIHSGIKPHVCQKCPRSFTTSADLIRHQRSHSEVKPHKCSKCSASFTRKDKLQKHYLAHLRKESEIVAFNEEGPTQTPVVIESNQQHIPYMETERIPQICSYPDAENISQPAASIKPTSNYGNSLLAAQLQKPQAAMRNRTDHLAVPKSNLKVHICNICSRAFTRKREFQRHQALHLDSLYRCKVCGKNFNRRDKLLRHEEVHHAEQYNCNQCNMSYTKLEALQMHVKVHELHNQSARKGEDGLPIFDNFQEEAPMALGFYSEIKPEE